jgi:hypothetical protein
MSNNFYEVVMHTLEHIEKINPKDTTVRSKEDRCWFLPTDAIKRFLSEGLTNVYDGVLWMDGCKIHDVTRNEVALYKNYGSEATNE